VILVVLGSANYSRPPPALTMSVILPTSITVGAAPELPWPEAAEAAVGLQSVGVLAATANATPRPIASTAKIMTALLTVEAHPLTSASTTPQLLINAGDVSDYLRFAAEDGSVVPVVEGETMSEYQALQALLIPSGNNIADLLARWLAGDTAKFVQEMNLRARQMGLLGTTFTDPSGFDPGTVSTPSDLVRLAQSALNAPVLASIVAQTSAVLPVAGIVRNVNGALGRDGIVGVKTGNTPQAKAVYVFAARQTQDPNLTVIGAIEGLNSLSRCFAAAVDLVDAVRLALRPQVIFSAGTVVGSYRSLWGAQTLVVAEHSISARVWPGSRATVALRAGPLAPGSPAHQTVGELSIAWMGTNGHAAVMTRSAVSPPSWRWRLLRRS